MPKMYKCQSLEHTVQVMQLLTNKVVLSPADSLIFTEALLNPREPTERQLADVAEYLEDTYAD